MSNFTITVPDDCGNISREALIANYTEMQRLATCFESLASVSLPTEFHETFTGDGTFSSVTITANSGTLPTDLGKIWVFLNGVKIRSDFGSTRFDVSGSIITFYDWSSGTNGGAVVIGTPTNNVGIEVAFFDGVTMDTYLSCLTC